MHVLTRLCGVLAGLLVLSCILACGITGRIRGAAEKQKRANDLKQLALSYHSFHDTHMRGPKDTKEWAEFTRDPDEQALIQQTGPGGRFVFFWNVKIAELSTKGPGSSQTVLGYESQVPTSEGFVVMGDGAVQQMSAAQFGQAAKANAFSGK
jgi:hypothetical protein